MSRRDGEPGRAALRKAMQASAGQLTGGAVQEDRSSAAPQSGEERREAQWQQHRLQRMLLASASVSIPAESDPTA